jgi:nicotinate-nucleotide adenylyltransferase
MVVANEPWQKVGERDISPAADRLAMVQAAVAGVDGLEASDVEITRGGRSYTVDTLRALAEEDPTRSMALILGSDAVAGLPTWEGIEDLPGLADIVVVERPGTEGSRPPAGFDHQVVAVPLLDVSSTEVRARVADGRPLDYLLTPDVIECVTTRGLYGSGAVA